MYILIVLDGYLDVLHCYLHNRRVCVYPGGKTQGNVYVTTADLSELRWDGWINETVIEFFLRYTFMFCAVRFLQQDFFKKNLIHKNPI